MPDIDRQYPIGKFVPKETYTAEEIKALIDTIEALPKKLESVLYSLTPAKLEQPYRPGGWTARQVIHHLADSHMNSYIRCKWMLTEETPVIKTYNEKAWAETPEVNADPALSLAIIKALHAKWCVLLRALTGTDLNKAFIHPETQRQVRFDRLIALYAWHSEHHLAHLKLIADCRL
ncbi:MAG: putative metal-dependent hydrolase [Cyclobacteriaceae bacterium]|nr:putative metal-dependent hydrolase [Cyclobacteriaceae bacterium]